MEKFENLVLYENIDYEYFRFFKPPLQIDFEIVIIQNLGIDS